MYIMKACRYVFSVYSQINIISYLSRPVSFRIFTVHYTVYVFLPLFILSQIYHHVNAVFSKLFKTLIQKKQVFLLTLLLKTDIINLITTKKD